MLRLVIQRERRAKIHDSSRNSAGQFARERRQSGDCQQSPMKLAIVASLIFGFCVSTLHGQQLQVKPANPVRGIRPIWQPVYAPSPTVPAEAKHLTGTGKFRVYLWSDGSVRQVQIAQSTGHAILDKAAVDALSKWRFHRYAFASWTLTLSFGSRN